MTEAITNTIQQGANNLGCDFLSYLKSDLERHDRKMKEDNTAKKARSLHKKTCREILNELLSQFKPLNFRELAELDEDTKITRKVYVILSVDEVIKKATSNKWGLCVKNGFTYLYNGRYWLPLDAGTLKIFLASAARKMGVPKMESNYYQFRDEIYKQFISVADMPTPESSEKVTLINLQNGTFEITTEGQKIRDYFPDDFLKYMLPFEYDPGAKCPIFDRYLSRVLPDENSRKALAEYIGYIFTTGLKLEKVAILYGSGANGKSVFFDIIQALIGRDNICTYSLQSLTKVNSYERVNLSNKLLNYASEINGKLEASIFKQLASGEPVEARQIYEQSFIMENYAKLMFNCNELPKEVENTHAFFRRFLIFPFTQHIPRSEQDPELSSKIIQNELSGVFNWMLEGLRRLLRQRHFTESKEMEEQLYEFQRDSDSVLTFLDEEGYKPDTENFVLLSSLYQDYRQYCAINGYTPCALKTVSKRLRNGGYKIERRTPGNVVYAKRFRISR